MISNSQLKALCRYKQQKTCADEGLFVVEGEKMCAEALLSDLEIVALCATKEWLEAYQSIIAHSANHVASESVYEISQHELERLSLQQSPSGAWMLLKRPACDALSEIHIAKEPLILLDGLQDPGNMGTIIRTADWFGITNIVAGEGTVSCFNPKVVQSSMGSIFRVKVYRAELSSFIRRNRDENTPVYGAVLNGANIYQCSFKQPAMLVIGNEAHGISPEVQTLLTNRLTIPRRGGQAESLNAAVATAIICSHWLGR